MWSLLTLMEADISLLARCAVSTFEDGAQLCVVELLNWLPVSL